MRSQFIDPGPLHPAQAGAVDGYLREIAEQNTGVFAFFLHGSSWTREDQFPDADIDIYYLEDNPRADSPLRGVVEQGDQLIELSPFFWGDVSRPRDFPLPTVVSLAHGHVLWERNPVLTRTRTIARDILKDHDWIERKILELLAHFSCFHKEWNYPAVLQDSMFRDWDFFRSTLMHLTGILSSVDLRPASFARKGLYQVALCSREIGLDGFFSTACTALGVADFEHSEAQQWLARIAQSYSHAQTSDAHTPLLKQRYYLTGAQTIIEKGWPQAAMWPLWRAAKECFLHTANLNDEHQHFCRLCFLDLATRLALADVPDLLQKTAVISTIIESLFDSRAALLNRSLKRAHELW